MPRYSEKMNVCIETFQLATKAYLCTSALRGMLKYHLGWSLCSMERLHLLYHLKNLFKFCPIYVVVFMQLILTTIFVNCYWKT